MGFEGYVGVGGVKLCVRRVAGVEGGSVCSAESSATQRTHLELSQRPAVLKPTLGAGSVASFS